MNSIYPKVTGPDYALRRRTDPAIAEQLYARLRGARRIVNTGAGYRQATGRVGNA